MTEAYVKPCSKCGGTDRYPAKDGRRLGHCRACQRARNAIPEAKAQRAAYDRRRYTIPGFRETRLAQIKACSSSRGYLTPGEHHASYSDG
jgi:hypothetical protein